MFTSASAALAVALALQSAPPIPPQPARPPAAIAEAWPDDKAVERFFPNLWKDMRALPSRHTLLIVGGGAAAAAAFSRTDDDLADWAADRGSSSWTGVGGALGDGWTQTALAVGTWGSGWISGDARLTHLGGDLIRAQALNGVVTGVIKVAVDRQRPNGNGHAFPSGHTSSVFTTASVLHGHFGWKVGLPAYAAASFVGMTRTRDRAHWVSDTVFGAAIGLAAGHTIVRGHRERAWVVVPSATTQGVAVFVMKR